MKKLYLFVPPCPRCQSRETGILLKKNMYTRKDTVKYLKKGVIPNYMEDVPDDCNCYCNSCGFSWPQDIEYKHMTSEEIDNEKRIRHTRERLEGATEEYQMSEHEKAKEFGLFGNSMRKFIGRI